MIQMFVKVSIVLFCAYFSSSGIFAQNLDDSIYVADVDKTKSYCFQFTWLGPKWDNTSELNTTCEILKAKPCMQPLVITHDGSPPNTKHMWDNYDISQISCKLTKGEACTKWVNYYANEISNITYMCSKYSVQGVSKTNQEGCEFDHNTTHSKEVCACRSGPGEEPCNVAHSLTAVHNIVLLLVAVVVSFLVVGQYREP